MKMSDYVRRAFRVQLASVMDALLKTAVCEIAKIFEGSLCEQQTELTQRVEEITALRGKLEKAERSLRGGGGELDEAAVLSADAETSSQTISSVVTDTVKGEDVPDYWCAPIQWDEPVAQSSRVMQENECPSVTLKALSVSLWRIPNIKQEVEEDDFESHLITALSTSPPHKRDERLERRLRRRLEHLNSSTTSGYEKGSVKVKKEGLTMPIAPGQRRRGRPRQKNDEELHSYNCRYCHRVFVSQAGLKVHIWSHKKCSICHKKFPSPSVLSQHMAASHRVKREKEKDGTEEKQNNHHKVSYAKLHSCERCNQKFRTNDLLNKHVENDHCEPWENEDGNDDLAWTMPIEEPTDEEATDQHPSTKNKSLAVSGYGDVQSRDQGKRPVKVKKEELTTTISPVQRRKGRRMPDEEISGHQTRSRNASKSESKDGVLKVGEGKRKNDELHSYNCKYCLKVCVSKAGLKVHLWSHKKCFKCHKTFAFPSFLRQHMTACHRVKVEKDAAEEKPKNDHNVSYTKLHPCKHCNHRFRTEYLLKNHLKNDHCEPLENEERNVDLDWTVPIDDEPTDHQPSTKSSPAKPATCNNWAKGKRQEATGKSLSKGFKCKVCKKVLSSKVTLMEHSRIHTGEKPVVCRNCGKRFRCHPVLSKHRNTCPGQAVMGKTVASVKFRCKDCTKTFSTELKLTNHRRVVHKTNLKTCKICGKGFSYIARLSQHYERVHA